MLWHQHVSFGLLKKNTLCVRTSSNGRSEVPASTNIPPSVLGTIERKEEGGEREKEAGEGGGGVRGGGT